MFADYKSLKKILISITKKFWKAAISPSVSLCFVLLLFFSQIVFAEWKSVGNVTQILEQKANYAILQTSSGAKLRVEFFDINVVRIRLAPDGTFETLPDFALDSSVERQTPIVKISQTKEKIVLINSFGAKIEIHKTPLTVTVFDEKGEIIVDDAKAMAFDSQTGEISAMKARKSLTETYYGFGEKALPFSRDGQVMTNWNTDTYKYNLGTDPLYQSIPFFIALNQGKSYGLFFNNTFRTTFDMGKTAPDKYSFSSQGGELDYFVFTGGKERTPKQILEDYANLTGKMPLPPIWALGNQQSRFSYFPESRVREIADGFRSRKIPCDVIYIDIDFMDGFRVFTWNKEAFPNPRKLTDDLREKGFKSVVIVDPAVKLDEKYPVYNDGKTKDLYVKNSDGTDFVGQVWAGKSVFPDFVNSKTREWFGEQYKSYITDGIDGFWNDMNEPANFPEGDLQEPIGMNHSQKTLPLDAKHTVETKIVQSKDMSKVYVEKTSGKKYNPLKIVETGGTHARFHNLYGMLMARSTFEGVRNLRPENRPFVLTRAGFSGVQRYAAVWTGDNIATWEHLRLSLPILLNLSVSGVPFVGADVGGYAENPSGELYARWLQAASFTPFLRSHSEKGAANKEPWEYGEEFTRINRATIELRYQFLPYLYTLFQNHEQTGQPILRPLWFEYPKDYKTYLLEDEYLVGRDLLVAPVLNDGQRKRGVYFPVGDDWRDWFTGEIYKGGTWAEINAPLDKLPIFARVGAVIPTQPAIQNTTEMPNVPITLNVITGIAPDKIETSKIFQDSGDGYDYQKTQKREISIEHKKGLLRLMRVGNFQGQKIHFIEALGISKRPSEMRVDGKLVENIEIDSTKNRLRITVDENVKEIALKP